MQHKQRSKRITQKELLRKSGQTEPRSDVGVVEHCALEKE